MLYSSFWRRFAARMIDFIIFMPFILINNYSLKPTHPTIYQINAYLISLLIFIYNLLFIYYKGATIGKIVLRMRVVQTDGSKITFLNSFLRELISLISLPLMIIKGITIGNTKNIVIWIENIYLLFLLIEHFVYFTNPNRKTIHDYIANTVVVSAKLD